MQKLVSTVTKSQTQKTQGPVCYRANYRMCSYTSRIERTVSSIPSINLTKFMHSELMMKHLDFWHWKPQHKIFKLKLTLHFSGLMDLKQG